MTTASSFAYTQNYRVPGILEGIFFRILKTFLGALIECDIKKVCPDSLRPLHHSAVFVLSWNRNNFYLKFRWLKQHTFIIS